MMVCPNCKNEERLGALFCSQCGGSLGFHYSELPSTRLGLFTQSEVFSPDLPVQPTGALVSLNIMDNGEILPVDGQEEITIGRVSEGQPIMPDVDLTPYQAYEAGVSRLHASIKFMSSGPVVTDLGSANGTRLNGKKIPPHTAQPLAHGDILTLGKFKVQVLLRS